MQVSSEQSEWLPNHSTGIRFTAVRTETKLGSISKAQSDLTPQPAAYGSKPVRTPSQPKDPGYLASWPVLCGVQPAECNIWGHMHLIYERDWIIKIIDKIKRRAVGIQSKTMFIGGIFLWSLIRNDHPSTLQQSCHGYRITFQVALSIGHLATFQTVNSPLWLTHISMLYYTCYTPLDWRCTAVRQQKWG